MKILFAVMLLLASAQCQEWACNELETIVAGDGKNVRVEGKATAIVKHWNDTLLAVLFDPEVVSTVIGKVKQDSMIVTIYDLDVKSTAAFRQSDSMLVFNFVNANGRGVSVRLKCRRW